MTLPRTDTIVTYPAGAMGGRGTVLHVEPLPDGRFAVLLDETPAHPVDAAWPDQGPDRTTLSWAGGTAELEDCVVGATDGATLHLGADVPVRKGAEGWAFVVAHVVTDAPPEGAEVDVTVDAEHRRALSLGHTGCHLVSLALNRAMADRWSKETPADALGSPDFDAAACTASRILERGSIDTYRLGKSLRKKGFVVEGLEDALPAIELAVNASLAEWVAADGAIRIERDGDALTDRRYWVCEHLDGHVRMPCGGTHAQSLGELGDVRAKLSLAQVEGGLELTMETRAG
jgi:alanyl-tRNA synthetase